MANPTTPPRCSRCGIVTESRFGDVIICDDCYHISGSCCPEFDPECLEAKAPTQRSSLPHE